MARLIVQHPKMKGRIEITDLAGFPIVKLFDCKGRNEFDEDFDPTSAPYMDFIIQVRPHPRNDIVISYRDPEALFEEVLIVPFDLNRDPKEFSKEFDPPVKTDNFIVSR